MYKTKNIKYNKLYVNTTNFRHSPVSTEKEAIKLNIDEDIDSFKKLVKSMSVDLRTVVFILKKEEDKFRVMDANRRLSVFRMIEDNSLIPQGEQYEDLKIMLKGSDITIPETVICDIYEDNDVDKRLLMNRLEDIHLSDDATKKDWNALSQYRASLDIGSKIEYPWVATLLFYEGENNDEIIKGYLDKNYDVFNTSLNRKAHLKIKDSGQIGLPNDVEIYNDILDMVISRRYKFLDGSSIKIDTRTKKEVFTRIISEIIAKNTNSVAEKAFKRTKSEATPHQPTTNSPKDTFTSGASSKVETIGEKLKFDKDIFYKCSTIIPGKFELSCDNVRINKVIGELKRLNVNNYPNSCGALLRVLFELSSKYYLERNEIETRQKNMIDVSFDSAISIASNDMIKKKLLAKDLHSNLSKDKNTLREIFNGHMHSTDHYPSTEVLKGLFKSHHKFIQLCLATHNND